MDEQFLTYWLSWIIFIMIVFFMEKTRKRLFFMFSCLLIIIVYPFYIDLQSVHLSIVQLMLLILSFICFVFYYMKVMNVITAFCLMLGCTAILIWYMITPVLFFMSPYVFVAVMILIGVHMTVKTFYARLAIALFSATFGHALYNYLLFEYGLTNRAENHILLLITIIILMLIFIQMIKYIVLNIMDRFNNALN